MKFPSPARIGNAENEISATVWAQKSRKPFCDFLLGVPLGWGVGYSVVNAFYCVTYNQNRIYGQDGRGGYSIAAVSRLFCYLIYFLFFVRTKNLKYLFYLFLHDFILFG